VPVLLDTRMIGLPLGWIAWVGSGSVAVILAQLKRLDRGTIGRKISGTRHHHGFFTERAEIGVLESRAISMARSRVVRLETAVFGVRTSLARIACGVFYSLPIDLPEDLCCAALQSVSLHDL
jgi:hypothetical protein